ncbi:LysM peptidoglycan-binding domain-containing protein [Neisseria sp.]|uniref:LysM peptidoglycan-binding domain-containing protein n=1 Tax=Neisseria sp. TaxID=192066 RepID=UPI0035A14B26
MAKLKTLTLTISGLSALTGAVHSHAASSNQVGMAMMRLNSSLIDQAQSKSFAGGSLWPSLRKNFRITEVNSELVRRHENKFSANRAYFDRTINRSRPYMYHIANEVKKRNMPAEIALLPFIESAFVTKAKSHVGASGLWQFMPATGRHFGLERTALYDGRHDVYAATDAALNYLQKLHGMFGDWSLALAAYNWGEGNVSRAINRARAQGLEPTYENLRMPQETRNYVPKLLAVRNIVNNPQTYGMNLSEINNKPYFKTVQVDKPLDTNAIIRLANISESEFLALNPAFNAPVFIPKANRKLLLPADAVSTFERNYRNEKPENLLSWNVYNSSSTKALNTIAAETGMSIAELKRFNSGFSGNTFVADKGNLTASNNDVRIEENVTLAALNTNNLPVTYRSNTITDTVSEKDSASLASVKPIEKTTAQESKPENLNFVRITSERDVILASAKPAETKQAQQTVPAPAKTVDVQFSSNQASPALTTAAKADFKPAQNTAITIAQVETAKPQAETSDIMALVSQLNKQPEQTANTTTEKVAETETIAANASAYAPISKAEKQIASVQPLLSDSNIAATDHGKDELMALAQSSTSEGRLNSNATAIETESVKQVATAKKARSIRIAQNRAKYQQRVASRLARSKAAVQTASAGTHRVGNGDTLFSISQRYNMSVADLITTNNIKGNNIRKGQLLNVSAKTKRQQPSIRNVAYTVRQGDTLNTIASRFNVDVNDIRRWNKNTRAVTPGQRLKLQGS